MKAILLGLYILCLTITEAFAYVPPSVSQAADQYNWQQCVYQNRNRCVVDQCSYVMDRDCQQTCLTGAKAECAVEKDNVQTVPLFYPWDEE